MRVYLLRHGIAEDGLGKPDADRAITPEGYKKLREILKALKRAGVAPTAVLASPYLRAMQTAELAVNELGYKGAIEEVGALTPDSSPRDAWAEIRVHKAQQEVLVVGHEPLFSSLTAFLLNSPSLLVDFKKGGVVAIDLASFTAQPHGVLCWYLTPKLAVS